MAVPQAHNRTDNSKGNGTKYIHFPWRSDSQADRKIAYKPLDQQSNLHHHTPPGPAHSRTCTKSPTRITPLPLTTPLHPKQAFVGLAASSPLRYFIKTLYGTALSLNPVDGSTLGD